MKQHYQTITVRVPVDEPPRHAQHRCSQFRLGQLHRKANLPCTSTNGAYLDGWYSPEQATPPYVTTAQAQAFNL